MLARVTISTAEGDFSGEIELFPVSDQKSPHPLLTDGATKKIESAPKGIDFDLPVRPFVKRHAAGRSGPKRLTILVAHAVKGHVGGRVGRTDVESQWARMTHILGGPYNSAYGVRARDNGWIDLREGDVLELLSGWEEVLR
jgi:hypothetical protein